MGDNRPGVGLPSRLAAGVMQTDTDPHEAPTLAGGPPGDSPELGLDSTQDDRQRGTPVIAVSNLRKEYHMGDTVVAALRGVALVDEILSGGKLPFRIHRIAQRLLLPLGQRAESFHLADQAFCLATHDGSGISGPG